jgi:hypothetical protein
LGEVHHSASPHTTKIFCGSEIAIMGSMSAPDRDMLGLLMTEARNPASEHLDELSTLEMLTLINAEDAKVAGAVHAELASIAQAVDAIAERFERGGRLFYIGAGTSGRLGVLDASECPPTFSVSAELVQGLIAGGDSALRLSSEHSEDSREEGARDLKAAGFAAAGEDGTAKPDTLVGIAASGRTPYVLGAVEYAKGLGAGTGRGDCHYACDRGGGADREYSDEGGNGDQAGAEYALDRGDGADRRDVRESDGQCAADECEAGGPRAEDHRRGCGVRSGGGGEFAGGCWECEGGDCDGEAFAGARRGGGAAGGGSGRPRKNTQLEKLQELIDGQSSRPNQGAERTN